MGYTVISAPHRAAPFHRFRHCALFELLTQRPNHTIAATTPHPLNASALAQIAAMPVSHGTFQPCAGMSVASVSLSIGRSQPNNYSACRFHTAHRQAPCSGLTLPWCHNAVAYIWCGITVLPCFCASGKVPVTRCGLPLRGTYAAYWPSSRLDCHTLPATTLRKVAAPIPSGQTGLDASRQAQFSASIVISM
jgi:hypothetical protein